MSKTASTAKKKALTTERIARLCAEYASNKKAEDVLVLDLRGISSLADFFVVCSGTSEPHLKAIAAEIEDKMRDEHALRPHNVDGRPLSQWIVVDYYDVLVHIFHAEKRAFYSLEDLWSDAPRLTITQ
ncbi:MAG TPA: ribosome silencing factor [Chthoniobacteraceae bacterium]